MPHRRLVRDWALDALERIFGAYMLWNGLSILLFVHNGINSPSFAYVHEMSRAFGIPALYLLSGIFLIPGLLISLRVTRRVGLLVACLFLLVHTVGTIRSVTLFDNAAITAPNTYGFLMILAGWLYLTERNT